MHFFSDFGRLREIEDTIELLEDLDGGYFKVFVDKEFGERFVEIDVTQIRARAVSNQICPPGFSREMNDTDLVEVFPENNTNVQSKSVPLVSLPKGPCSCI